MNEKYELIRYRKTRKEFEREIFIVSEKKLYITKRSKDLINGLKNARYAPNKRINLSTINSVLRSALMSYNFLDKDSNV